MKRLRVLLYETPDDPYMNLAFEEAFVRVRGYLETYDTLRIWRNKNAVVIGYFQKAEEEVKWRIVNEHNANVVRRFTGGGAVYHDLGNINYAIVVGGRSKADRDLGYVFGFLIKGIIYALETLGFRARLENINDVVIDRFKVSGTAASIKWNTFFFHGSLLVDTNLELLYQILKIPKIKLLDKGISDVKYRVKNLVEIARREISYEEIISSIVQGYSKLLDKPYFFDLPSKLEIDVAKALYDLKYTREDWNMGMIRGEIEDVEEYLKELIMSYVKR